MCARHVLVHPRRAFAGHFAHIQSLVSRTRRWFSLHLLLTSADFRVPPIHIMPEHRDKLENESFLTIVSVFNYQS